MHTLWQHSETGRTRIVTPEQEPPDDDAGWVEVGRWPEVMQAEALQRRLDALKRRADRASDESPGQ